MERTRSAADGAYKQGVRSMWALGDYHRFAKATVWEVGEVLVRACEVSRGQRLLDVAAGTGNVAIQAAEAGARAVASDLTPEHFEAGRREASERGVELEWVEADAEALPFADGEFDVVTSCFGAMFAPDHPRVADELVRVCRPGGTIGMANFRAEATTAAFFDLLGRYLPPAPSGAGSPLLWGQEEHVRTSFGDRIDRLESSHRRYVERAPTPDDYVRLFKENFGPLVAIDAGLADQPDRRAALDRDLRAFAASQNRGAPGGAAEYHYDYLLVVARRRDA